MVIESNGRVQELEENIWMPCDHICDDMLYCNKLQICSYIVYVRVEVYYTGIIQHYSTDLASFSNIILFPRRFRNTLGGKGGVTLGGVAVQFSW